MAQIITTNKSGAVSAGGLTTVVNVDHLAKKKQCAGTAFVAHIVSITWNVHGAMWVLGWMNLLFKEGFLNFFGDSRLFCEDCGLIGDESQ